jgi:30S ribosomal protein S31
LHSIVISLNLNNMGRGDKKTKKGKRTAASYGVSRPRAKAVAKAKALAAPAKEEKVAKVKKVAKVTEPKAEKPAVKKTVAKKKEA